MRIDSKSGANDLHWHDGTTCHGTPTLQACVDEAIRRQWVGKVLEKTDIRGDSNKVKCYSLIVSSFEHWSKHGKFVAEVRRVFEIIPIP